MQVFIIECPVCGEQDPCVLVECRDGVTRCAHHAVLAGFCWDCGEGEPRTFVNDDHTGLCHDCQSADIMAERKIRRAVRP